MNVKLIAIAALGKNREIGLNGHLPWSIPEEYRHFLETVQGQNVLIGRKNFESNDGDIEGATPIILTRDTKYSHEGVLAAQTIQEAVALTAAQGKDKLYVIGGGEVYRLTLPYLSEFLWSEVDYAGPADVFFPEFLQYPWTKMSEVQREQYVFRRLVKSPQNL